MEPLCFLTLFNDALQDDHHPWKYIDDYTGGVTIDNSASDYDTLQNILDQLQSWTVLNHVTINTGKTVVMHFNTNTAALLPVLSAGSYGFYQILGVPYDSKQLRI